MTQTPGPGFYNTQQGEKILSKSPRVIYGYISSSGVGEKRLASESVAKKNQKDDLIGPGYYEVNYSQISPRAVLGNISPSISNENPPKKPKKQPERKQPNPNSNELNLGAESKITALQESPQKIRLNRIGS